MDVLRAGMANHDFHSSVAIVTLVAIACVPLRAEAQGAGPPRRPPALVESIASYVERWNEIAIDASGLDHTPLAPGEQRTYGEQLGPGRSGRAMAIVHIAMFEVVNAVTGGYESYLGLPRSRPDVYVGAAIAQAAHDALVALYPSQSRDIDRRLREDLIRFAEGGAKQDALALGRRAAASILATRADDGAAHPEPLVGVDYRAGEAPGEWRPDPISRSPYALGAHWGHVAPFVLRSADQFRTPPPPALESLEYAEAFDEVLRLGGDGVATPTVRTVDQELAGIYWAYDGMPSLCAPPRLYNQIAMRIAHDRGADGVQIARLLALVNIALADAGTAVWESKYFYRVWRPVTAIREADRGTGPSGAGDGNPWTTGDPTFTPLGAPASNSSGPNFTPPFPSYPSGHAGFGGALFQVLRRFFGADDIAFTFVSDEMNGETRDRSGSVRPRLERRFASLSEAEDENGQSRIYLGIHWSFDKTAGITQGRQVGDFVVDHVFRPRSSP